MNTNTHQIPLHSLVDLSWQFLFRLLSASFPPRYYLLPIVPEIELNSVLFSPDPRRAWGSGGPRWRIWSTWWRWSGGTRSSSRRHGHPVQDTKTFLFSFSLLTQCFHTFSLPHKTFVVRKDLLINQSRRKIFGLVRVYCATLRLSSAALWTQLRSMLQKSFPIAGRV